MAQIFTIPRQFAIRSDGTTYPGMRAFFYRAGTLTDLTVYQDANLTTAHPQPVVADDQGMLPPIYIASNLLDYRVILRTSGLALISDTDNVPRSSATAAELGETFHPRTTAEINAGVTPANYVFPEMDLRRYGGSPVGTVSNNNAAIESAILVSGQNDKPIIVDGGTWAFSAPWSLTGTGQRYGGGGTVSGGSGARGCRVVGIGRPVLNFLGLTSAQDAITLGGPNLPQVEMRNIQIQCNSAGRDGLVLRGSNSPILDNINVFDAQRDAFVMECNGSVVEWIEKGEFDLHAFAAGRHGLRMSLTGTLDPFINENLFRMVEVRGCGRRYNGGTALWKEAVSGLGAAAKMGGNVFEKTVFDCAWTSVLPFGPGASPVVAAGFVVVQNCTFNSPAWENTGAESPGSGPPIDLQGSASWGGLTFLSTLTNSFWGTGDLDPGITGVTHTDFSYRKTRLMGPVQVDGTDGSTGVNLTGKTTALGSADFRVVRTGSAVDTIGRGASFLLGNTTTDTYLNWQEHNGDAVLYLYSSGAWNERLRIKADGTLVTTGAIQIPDGIAAPATVVGKASIYVDSGTGDASMKFGDGFTAGFRADS